MYLILARSYAYKDDHTAQDLLQKCQESLLNVLKSYIHWKYPGKSFKSHASRERKYTITK